MLCMLVQKLQPLSWLARSSTRSRMACGSGDCSSTALSPAKRLPNLAETSLANRSKQF